MDDQTKGIDPERASGRMDEYVSGREALDTDGRIGERGTSRIPSRADGDSERMHAPESARNVPSGSPDVRARELRAEIERTRGEMSETVDAIQDRLRPSNLAADAAESVKNSVKQAAGDQARMVADTARDFAESEPVMYVRANPIPAAMVGVGLAGLAWLAFGGRETPSRRFQTTGRTARDWRRGPYDDGDRFYRGGVSRGGYGGGALDARSASFGDAGFGEAGYPGQSGYDVAARSSEFSGGAARSWTEGGSAGRSWTDAGAEEFAEVSDRAAALGRRAQQKGREATRSVERAWQQNPLLMGAASAVLGLMVGMAIPETEIENEYMGETRDQALEGVQQTVRETVGKVQDAATSAVEMIAGGDASAESKQAGSSNQAGFSNQGGSSGQARSSSQGGSSQAGRSGPAGSPTRGASGPSGEGSNPAVRNQQQKPLGSSPTPRKPDIS